MNSDLVITLKQFHHMIKQKSIIFYVALLSITFSVVGILFYSGYFFYDYYQYENVSSLEVHLEKNTSKEDIIEVISRLKENEKTIRDFLVLNESDTAIIGEYNSQFSERILVGNNIDFFSCKAEAIMPEYMIEGIADGQYPIGNQMKIDNKELTLVGIISIGEYDACIVPVNYFCNNFSVDWINCKYNTVLSRNEYMDICNYLKDQKFISNYSFVRKTTPFSDISFVIKFIQIFLIFLATMINSFVVLYYWITCFKRDYMIYSICGASKKKVKGIIISHSFIFILCAIILGNLFFLVLLQFLRNYNLVYVDGYDCYLMVSVWITIALVLFAVKMANKIMEKHEIYRTAE